MLSTVIAALDAELGGRPLHKLVLVVLACSSGGPSPPIRVTAEIVARTELSQRQFMATLGDLERLGVVQLTQGQDTFAKVVLP